MFRIASFPVFTPSYVVKKSRREPGRICHVKCVISAGRVRGFVECSDLAALLVHMESQKSSCKFAFKLSERAVRDERQS